MLSNTIHQFVQQFIMDTVMEYSDDGGKLSFHWKFHEKKTRGYHSITDHFNNDKKYAF